MSYHLHISKYIMVRDSVRQGSKFGPESRPNPEKQNLDPFVKMCSMGEHISNPWYHWRTLKLGKADSGHLAFKAWEHAGKSSLFSIVTTTSRLLNCTENKPFEDQRNLFTYQEMDVFTLSLYCFILDTLFPITCYVQNTAKHCKTRSSPPQALVCQFGLTFLATLHATVGIIHVSCQPWASPHLQGINGYRMSGATTFNAGDQGEPSWLLKCFKGTHSSLRQIKYSSDFTVPM